MPADIDFHPENKIAQPRNIEPFHDGNDPRLLIGLLRRFETEPSDNCLLEIFFSRSILQFRHAQYRTLGNADFFIPRHVNDGKLVHVVAAVQKRRQTVLIQRIKRDIVPQFRQQKDIQLVEPRFGAIQRDLPQLNLGSCRYFKLVREIFLLDVVESSDKPEKIKTDHQPGSDDDNPPDGKMEYIRFFIGVFFVVLCHSSTAAKAPRLGPALTRTITGTESP